MHILGKRLAQSMSPVFLVFCFVMLYPTSWAMATELDIRTLTLFNMRSRSYTVDQEKKEYLGYEYIDLSVRDINDKSFSFYAHGWGRESSALVFGEKTDNGSLTYAFLSYSPKKYDTLLEIGRIFSFESSSLEQYDGIAVSGQFIPQLKIKLFGGHPVNSTPKTSGRGDLIYGAHAMVYCKNFTEVGITYLIEDMDNSPFRKESGADLWFHPVKFFDLSGHLFYNNLTDNISHYRGLVRVTPNNQFALITEVSKFKYKDYLFASPLSVFELQKEEELQKMKVALEFQATAKLYLNVNYQNFEFVEKDHAGKGSFETRYSFGDQGSSVGVSYNRMEGNQAKNTYDEIQSFLFFKKNKFQMSLYFIDTMYDKGIYRINNIYQFLCSAGFQVKDNLTVSADFIYDKNSQYKQFLSGMMRFDYKYSVKF